MRVVTSTTPGERGEESAALALVDAAEAGDWAAARDACQRLHADQTHGNQFNAAAFLLAFYHEDVVALDREDRECLTVEWADLEDVAPRTAHRALDDPDALLDDLEAALRDYDHLDDVDGVHGTARVRGLPEESTFSVGEHYAETVTDLIDVEAQIVKRSSVDPKLDVGVFVCLKCGMETEVPQRYGSIRKPLMCEGCEQKTAPFKLRPGRSEWTDYQKLRLQQLPEELSDGETETIDANLTGDLARRGLESGQRVTVTAEYVPWSEDDDVVHSKLLDAVDVALEDDAETIDPTDYREEIDGIARRDDPVPALAGAVAPNHQGDPHVKEGLILQLVRANSPTDKSGKEYRGTIHQLLLGEPGTGKSDFGNALVRISPRGKKASGNEGTSAAGLTAAIARDDFGDAEFSITAGAIPQCSGGAIFIDELDKAGNSEQNSMLEAMEDQIINIQKAGQEATLEADTAVFAAANPESSHFVGDDVPIAQTDIDSALLDRFDLIFCPTERTDREEIESVAGHVVDAKDVAVRQQRDEDVPDELLEDVEPEVRAEVLRAYVAEARALTPRFASDDVKDVLRAWYVDVKTDLVSREQAEDRTIPVTPRSLLDLVRLAEASARARHSERIELVDVHRATRLKARSFAEMGLEDVGSEVEVEEDADGDLSVSTEEPRVAIANAVDDLTLEGPAYGAVPEDVVDAAADETGASRARVADLVEEMQTADTLRTVDDRLVTTE